MVNRGNVLKSCIVFLACVAAILPLQSQSKSGIAAAPKFVTLYRFGANPNDGAYPESGLVQGTNGVLYGTTSEGGSYALGGTIFGIGPENQFKTIVDFVGANGFQPWAALTLGVGGKLFGVTEGGGAYSGGTIFSMTPLGGVTTLFNFCSQKIERDCIDGSSPGSGLVQYADGSFYGVTGTGGLYSCGGDVGYGCGTVFRISSSGQFAVLYSFCPDYPSCPDGYDPAGLTLGPDGNFYGVTTLGGPTNSYCMLEETCGTIFKITPHGEFTTIYSFCLQSGCPDGALPTSGLTLGNDGNFYGVTNGGGAPGCAVNDGCGTIFRFTTSGILTTLYTFCRQTNCPDGSNPGPALAEGSDGNFYGVTYSGGAYDNCSQYEPPGCGTVFRVTPTGSWSLLHSFCAQIEHFSCTDGHAPRGTLAQSTSGVFYGTTQEDGHPNGDGCCGTVFAISVNLGAFVRPNPVAGRAGSNVGILGTDLTGASSVSFNGVATAFRVVSKTFIEAKVPSGATSGKIQVVTPAATLSSNVSFIVLK